MTDSQVTIARHVHGVEPVRDGAEWWDGPTGYVGVCSCGWRGHEMKLHVHAKNEAYAHAEYWNQGIRP